MSGTYEITENKTDRIKFRAMVSFNGKAAEYWEHDSLAPAEIEKALQLTADNDAVNIATLAEPADSISIVDGKIVVPEASGDIIVA